jgi:glycosyltransferase involved in cell wall biosynthesis
VKVLLINKFHYLAGGAERYVFDWARSLRAHGHEVIFFSMRHPANEPCAESEFFVPRVRFDFEQSATQRLRAAAHSIWSTEARKCLQRLLGKRGAPDIVHLNSFMFQLTPSILKPLVRRGIQIVQTCHEYAHICINQHMFNYRTNRICDRCIRHGRLSPLWTGCIKGSFAASLAGCAACAADELLGGSRRVVRRFFTPGEFMRRKYVQGGIPSDRVFHVPHPMDPNWITPGEGPGGYMLFLGRLAPYKGIMTFLDAAERVPEVPCRIVGGGPMEEQVRARLTDGKLGHVKHAGWLRGEALKEAVRGARAVVVPSEWYEPFGYVILEAMLAARPVIATNIAGPAELVSLGEDGLLFPLRDAGKLAVEMKALWDEPERATALGETGREKVLGRHDPERHYEVMMRHFKDVVR